MKLGKAHKVESGMATKDPANAMAVLNGKRVHGTQYSGMAKVTTTEGMAARWECFPNFGRSWVINEMYSNGVPRGSSWMDDYFKYDMDHVNDSFSLALEGDGWSPEKFKALEYADRDTSK